jgi:hypothetical protein
VSSGTGGGERLLDGIFGLLRAAAYALSGLERRLRGRPGAQRGAWLALAVGLAGLLLARGLAAN